MGAENLEMIAGASWKVSPEADEGEEVMPSDVPPAPSPTPIVPRVPPTAAVMESGMRVHVTTKEPDRIGFTLGCLGCRSIVEKLRGRVITRSIVRV